MEKAVRRTLPGIPAVFLFNRVALLDGNFGK